MVIVGLHMAAKSMRIDFQDARQSVPFFVTVFGTLLTASLPLGTALGTLAFALTELAAGQGETGKTYLRRLGVPSLVMLPVSLLLIALSIL